MHQIQHHITEGPAGVSILCFIGGLVTTLVGTMGLIGGILGSFLDPFHYVLNGYLMIFGAVTVLLEADVEFVRKLKLLGHLAPILEKYQTEVEQSALFLTELFGRGLFYLFVGSLAITQCVMCLQFLIGIWNVVMGVLCLLMSFGINPASVILRRAGPNQSTAPLVNSQAGFQDGF